MPPTTEPQASASTAWLWFSLLTVVCWGVYGILLHRGQQEINPMLPPDPNARYKAFLWVGVAYFLVAILAPIAVLILNGASWTMKPAGITWSLVAGIAGAIGAFGVLLAFGAAPKGKTLQYVPVIMSIIFAGAPVVNAAVSIALHPPEGGLGSIKPLFWVGILLAAAGGFFVTLYKPDAPAKKPAPAVGAPAPAAAPAASPAGATGPAANKP